ncbi:BTB domain-containing protein [Mycena indigotica]|uniref:BTB domain-containing protein n=1 Tax=Mycena indigotica TaxID=2126181 RepID=A0A8H6WEL6_9AGAR|nr:BTB domain-containing protein [Mycena indigotica]KAF7314942.1 BTB domain-containing protein [Mycena indigotica]
MHSPVFKDMLGFSQPAEAERVEGQPLVRLTDLEVEVTPFLKALFEPEFFLPFPAKTDFVTIYGCVRLGNKYCVDYLKRRGLIHLSSQFPTTLARYDAIDPDAIGQLTRAPSEVTSWDVPNDQAYLISVAQLAREVDALWLLPQVYYDICRHLADLGEVLVRDTIFNGITARLSMRDTRNMLLGCSSPDDCAQARFRLLPSVLGFLHDYSANPLDIWTAEEWPLFDGQVCQEIWDELPLYYGLGNDWTELEKHKLETIGDVVV